MEAGPPWYLSGRVGASISHLLEPLFISFLFRIPAVFLPRTPPGGSLGALDLRLAIVLAVAKDVAPLLTSKIKYNNKQ